MPWPFFSLSRPFALSPPTVSGTAQASRVIRLSVEDQQQESLFWAPFLFPPRGSRIETTRLALLGPGGVIFDSFKQSQTLHDIPIGVGASRVLVEGNSVDRQPAFAPDGNRFLFSSNRNGNVDLFSYEMETGEVSQLTDHPGSDWDGAYTPDGKSIIWGSDRGGNLEIWLADADGSNPRQVTQDGVGAENPTMTRDGKWIVYTSDNREHPGICKIRTEGTDWELLVGGAWTNAEVSPDGRYALHLAANDARLRTEMRVIDLSNGELLDFLIRIDYQPKAPNVSYGRGRWMPDGKQIAFIGIDDEGRTGIWVQDFSPGKDTTATRRALIPFRADLVSESFDVSPDSNRVILSTVRQDRSLNVVDGLPLLP